VSEPTATVTISHPAPAVLDRLAAAWRSLFGLEARVTVTADRCPQVAVTSETAVAFLEFVAGGQKASYRRIPAAVLASPRDMVLAYLQGLLAYAGVARVAGAATVTIGLASASLLDDLQAVLTNLGIVHRRGEGEIAVAGDAARDLFDLAPPADPGCWPRRPRCSSAATCRAVPATSCPDCRPGSSTCWCRRNGAASGRSSGTPSSGT
jgi:hypothetical protein